MPVTIQTFRLGRFVELRSREFGARERAGTRIALCIPMEQWDWSVKKKPYDLRKDYSSSLVS